VLVSRPVGNSKRGCGLEKSIYRVLVVDDYEPWRSFATRTLQQKPELQVVGEASDGLDAVQKAQELQPDLILLDIGLPKLNGIEVARRMVQYSSTVKILFLSEQGSSDIVEEAMGTGAKGYVVKSQAATVLLQAVEAVLQGKQFVSAKLTDSAAGDPEKGHASNRRHREAVLTPMSVRKTASLHEVGFYADEKRLVDDVTRFIAAALNVGNAAVVVATEPHLSSFLRRFQAMGVDIDNAIRQGRYVTWDVADALSTFMVDGMVGRVRLLETSGDLLLTAAKAATGNHPRVAMFAECAPFLWAQGHTEAAIEVEILANELIRSYDVKIRCGYLPGGLPGGMDADFFRQVCAQHSAIDPR
jgi:DNA-binding NarL/FixJ family response regulator